VAPPPPPGSRTPHHNKKIKKEIDPTNVQSVQAVIFSCGPNNQQKTIQPLENTTHDTTAKYADETAAALDSHCNEVGLFFVSGLNNSFHCGTIHNHGSGVNVFAVLLLPNSDFGAFGISGLTLNTAHF